MALSHALSREQLHFCAVLPPTGLPTGGGVGVDFSSPPWNSPRGQALSQVRKGFHSPSLTCWDLLPPGLCPHSTLSQQEHQK